MLIWTGTAAVENGSTTVVVDTGAALTAEVVAHGAMVVLDGIVYFADSLTDTTTLELTRVYAGSTGTADMEIWPVSQDTTNLVNLAQIVARTQAQINILDKNSQGLFFNMKGVTGAADPGPGFIAFDDADPALVTEAYIDVLDANGRAVDALIGLWEPGTTIIFRSLTTTAYRAYTVVTNTLDSGWGTIALGYLGHDGVLANNEALSICWSLSAAGLEIDATGNFEDRDDYDDEPAGFVFLSADGDGDTITMSVLFRKNSGTTADWGVAVPFQGPQGARGWSPVFAVVNDSNRRVLRLVDYVGGELPKPTSGIDQYVSSGGLTGTIGSATDIRGPQGLSAYEVAVVNGYSGSQSEWLASLVGASAYQVAVANGFSGNETEWLASLIGSIEGVTSFWQSRLLVDTTASAARTGLGITKATTLMAEAGVDDASFMTSLTTAAAIAALAPPSKDFIVETAEAALKMAELGSAPYYFGGGSNGSGVGDAISTTDLIDVAGATNLSTAETGALKPTTTSESAISQATGTNIGDMTAQGGLAGAFDGSTATVAARSTSTPGYVGKNYSSAPKKISKVTVQSQNSAAGFDGTSAASNINITLYGKNGDAPSNGTDGTPLGTTGSFADATGPVTKTITSSDQATLWDYVWVYITSSAAEPQIAEVVFYEPGIVNNMTVASDAFVAASAPGEIRLLAVVEEVDTAVIGDDYSFEVSRDGSDFGAITMANIMTVGTKKYYWGTLDTTALDTGTDVKWRMSTTGVMVELHGYTIGWQ
jgi:hypothetical protein